MSPDSALGQLAQRVSRVEQRVEDLMTRVVERFTEAERSRGDLRSEIRELRDELRRAVKELRGELVSLDQRLDSESEERRKGQQERKNELADAIADRRRESGQTRTMMKVAAIGLIGTFITSGGAVLVAIFTGAH